MVESVWLSLQGRVCRELWEVRPEESQGPDIKDCSPCQVLGSLRAIREAVVTGFK